MQKTNKYDLIKFEDGEFSLDVNVSPNEDTVWLTQEEMALLFNVDRSRITRHIKNILENKEIEKERNVRKTHFPHSDKLVSLYNLDMVLAVGYRVNSKRGILFRKWATSILKQYMMNGYSLNEKRCFAHSDSIVNLSNDVEIIKDKINIHHNLTIIKTNKIHDRFIIIDDTIYLCGSSIKDVGRKRFVLTKIDFASSDEILKRLV